MYQRVKKSDFVQIKVGKDRGKTGKVVRLYPQLGKLTVENLNLIKKHLRPRRQGESGQIVERPRRVDLSNVMPVCGRCGRGVRVGVKTANGQKVRFCRRCQSAM